MTNLNSISDFNNQQFMLNSFSYNERFAYISMLTSLAWADGSIDYTEQNELIQVANNAGKDIADQLDDIIKNTRKFNINCFEQWINDIKKSELKYSLMVDMFLIAFADNICMESETIYMKYIAGKLEISDDVYYDIRNSVELYLKQDNINRDITYENGIVHNQEKDSMPKSFRLKNKMGSFIRAISAIF
ncbi:MAG: TerB family tellurite resistance protein [Bacteroidales bacterium]|nr:TerB family tellurite resistance protein [Bacteroidales bacterium]